MADIRIAFAEAFSTLRVDAGDARRPRKCDHRVGFDGRCCTIGKILCYGSA